MKPQTLLALVVYYVYHAVLVVCFLPAKWLWTAYLSVPRLLFPSTVSPLKVVVVGGGFAGSMIAKAVAFEFASVTLIDTRDYFEFTPSILRTLVEPEHVKTIQVMHRNYLPSKVEFIQGEVVDITPKTLVIRDWWKELEYDVLVVATGSTYTQPFKQSNAVIATRADALAGCASKLAKSQSVLIIGGGAVGVELAAEITEAFRDKELTIVHSGERLLHRMPLEASHYAERYFASRGTVRLLLEQRVVRREDTGYRTDKDVSLRADLAFLCTGISPNSQLFRRHFADCLTESGFVRTTDTLQVVGHPNIFVAGDVAEQPAGGEKLAQSAQRDARVVIENLRQYGKSEVPHTNLVTASSMPMIISLGKLDAVLVYGKQVLTGIIPGLLKEAVEWKVMINY